MPSKKALLIGINYIGSSSELNGCINDVKNIREMLIKKKYNSRDITLLTDLNISPTKKNILKHLKLLVRNAKSGDTIYVHYSGHGGQVKDKNRDEIDFIDETIVALDGYITDDMIFNYFLKPMPSKVNVFMVMDACHSGTVCDLKYNYTSGNNISNNIKYKDTRCNVIMISGCKDEQVSMDAFIEGSYQGAMTNSFLVALNNSSTYKELISHMRTRLLRGEFIQIPQLSSGRHFNINQKIKF